MIKKVGLWLILTLLIACLSTCLFATRQKAIIPYQAVAIAGKVSPKPLKQLQVDI